MFRHYIQQYVISILLSGIVLLGYSNALSATDTNISPSHKPVIIGILVPLEHTALKDIVEGFKAEVSQHYPKAVFSVKNAQGDIKVQRSIIEQFVGNKVDIIVPIGTTATQMTLSFVKNIPVISLAAEYSEAERLKRQPRNVTGVHDEIGGKKKLDFLRQVYPNLKKLTIIYHSSNEKNFREIEDIISYGKTLNVAAQKLSIHTLPDLETAIQGIDKDSEALLILKDHLIVSGMPLLLPTAKERGIPVMSSDEGSVQDGATFALGVQERSIGEEGGKLAIQLLKGQAIEELPMQDINTLAVFYNPKALSHLKDALPKLKETAEKQGYALIKK